jgi:phospholipid/cholesterol/gamma-HCH transport system substrate-binding protein
MKKISNEVKVGITALLTIVVFIWLYSFLKGKNLFTRTAHYYVKYEQIAGLAESSPIEVNGYKVGVVQSVKLLNPESDRLLVVLSIEKQIGLPKNTVAEITTASLIAGMKIRMIYGAGPGIYSNGDTIPGRLAESIISKVENELVPVKDKIINVLGVLDSVITSVNDIMDPQFRVNVRKSISNLSSITGSVDESQIKSSVENINKFTEMLAENTENLSATFENLKTVSDTLAAADLYNSIYSLKSTLENTATLMESLNSGKGSAGQFMTNDSLYRNLSSSLESLNLLLQDMRVNPKRYVHFSLFGKKNIPPGE